MTNRRWEIGRRLRLHNPRNWRDLAPFSLLARRKICVHPESLCETMSCILSPLPRRRVISGAAEWFELTWQSSVECVFFTCWQLAKRKIELGGWEEEEEEVAARRRIFPCGVALSCGPPLCQVARRRDSRTPSQLIKVRCGWMPGVTHDSRNLSWSPLFFFPRKRTHTHNIHAHMGSADWPTLRDFTHLSYSVDGGSYT